MIQVNVWDVKEENNEKIYRELFDITIYDQGPSYVCPGKNQYLVVYEDNYVTRETILYEYPQISQYKLVDRAFAWFNIDEMTKKLGVEEEKKTYPLWHPKRWF